MQSTILDPTLSETLASAESNSYKLVIANKNYSSWSMRPWVVMTRSPCIPLPAACRCW